MHSGERPPDRGQSAVLGELLMVGVVVVVAAGIATGAFLLAGAQPTIQAETVVNVEETSAGTTLEVQRIGQSAEVRIEGEPVATLNESDAGRSVYLPTAPGEEVTVVASEGEQSLLLSETVDRGEAGDFIAYYTFASGSGSTVVDGTGNANDGTTSGDPGGLPRGSDAEGTYMAFDGSDDYVNMGDLTLDGPDAVDEITVVMKYEKDGGNNGIQNLVEHQDSNFAWFVETDGPHVDPHQMEFNVGYQRSPSGKIVTSDLPEREPQVLVGTYDGEEMVLYRNGTRVGTETFERNVRLGEVILAADSDPSSVGQNFKGKLYEFRLYYTAFDDDEVATITERLD